MTFAVVTMGVIGTLQMFDQVLFWGCSAPRKPPHACLYIYENAFPAGASSRLAWRVPLRSSLAFSQSQSSTCKNRSV